MRLETFLNHSVSFILENSAMRHGLCTKTSHHVLISNDNRAPLALNREVSHASPSAFSRRPKALPRIACESAARESGWTSHQGQRSTARFSRNWAPGGFLTYRFKARKRSMMDGDLGMLSNHRKTPDPCYALVWGPRASRALKCGAGRQTHVRARCETFP